MRNPNNFNDSEFNIDNEIAKLWQNLEEEFANIKQQNSDFARNNNQNNQKAGNFEAKKLVPPPAPTGNPTERFEPEIPNFARNTSNKLVPPPAPTGNPTEKLEPVIPNFKRSDTSREKVSDSTNWNQISEVSSIFSKKPPIKSQESEEFWPVNIPVASIKDNEEFKSINIPVVSLNFDRNQDPGPEIPSFMNDRKKNVYGSNEIDYGYLDELAPRARKIEINNAVDREKTRSTGEKVIKSAKVARRILKNLNKIVGEEVEELRSRTEEYYETAKSHLDEKYQVFRERDRGKKKKHFSVGQKTVATVLAALTITGISAAAAYDKRGDKKDANQNIKESVTTENPEYEEWQNQDSFTLVSENGDKITASFENEDEMSSVNEEETTLTDNNIQGVGEESATQLSDENSAETGHNKFKFNFSSENPNVSKAIEKIDGLLENGISFSTEGRLSNLIEMYSKIGLTKKTTCALIGNHLQELVSLNPYSTGEGGIGPFQFWSENARRFVAWEAENYPSDYEIYQNGGSSDHWARQMLLEIKFFMNEESSNWNNFLSHGGSAREQALWFSKNIERPGEPMNENRMDYAEETENQIDEGTTELSADRITN